MSQYGIETIFGGRFADSLSFEQGSFEQTPVAGITGNNGQENTGIEPCAVNGVMPSGIGVTAGGSAELGVGRTGASAQGSVGVVATYDPRAGAAVDGVASGAAVYQQGETVQALPEQTNDVFVFGAFAGGGPSLVVTNARSSEQLTGQATTLSANIAGGNWRTGIQMSYTPSGVYAFSIALPIPYASGGAGFSLSKVTTNTGATQGPCGQK